MLRWGILGTARINRRLIPAIRAAARSSLVAVASRSRYKVDPFAKQWEIPRAVEGYEALLADPAIDAVYIPLPNSEHVPWTLAAIDAGKHVLCEKPLALDPDDVDRISAAAGARGVVVEEGFMYRHEPQTARVIELLRAGAIGEIRAIMSGFTFAQSSATDVRLDPALGGGAMWDVGCYPVSYAQLITDALPKIASASARWHASGVDEEFFGLLRFEAAATAMVVAGFRTPYRTWLEILGTGGSMRVPNPFRPSPHETIEIETSGELERLEIVGSAELFVREIEDFEAAVLDGAPQVVSLSESRRTVATLAALYAAARE